MSKVDFTSELFERAAAFYEGAPTGQYDEEAAHALRCHFMLLEALKESARVHETTAPKPPAWQDVLGDAEQLVRQKHIFSKYIKGTILENDVPVWIADFALRLVQRDRAMYAAALERIRAGIVADRCDGDTEYAEGVNSACGNHLKFIKQVIKETSFSR